MKHCSFKTALIFVIVFTTLYAVYQSYNTDISHFYSNQIVAANTYSFEQYFNEILTWISHPSSFCVENYANIRQSTHSSIVIISISNFNGGVITFTQSDIVTKEFIFYLRLSRILYINKHGYKYCEFQETFDRTRPPHWSKFNAIRMVSTLQNIKHIIWIDIDAIFHSQSTSIEASALFGNANTSTKDSTMIFTQSLSFKHPNCGFFMANNIKPNILDFLDLLEYVIANNDIKTHSRTFEQRVINFILHHNKTIFDKYCIILPFEKQLQLFHGPNYIQNLNYNKYEFFVWHWTGIKQRYNKMIFVLKQEIALLLMQQHIHQSGNIFDKYYSKYNLDEVVTENLSTINVHEFEPEWIKNAKICKSRAWTSEKTILHLGKVYDLQTIRELCNNSSQK
eukprot:173864_1